MTRGCGGAAARYGLSEREARTLELLWSGVERAQTADAMGVSPWTAKSYIKSIYKKVGVHSYAELMGRFVEDES